MRTSDIKTLIILCAYIMPVYYHVLQMSCMEFKVHMQFMISSLLFQT